jgi:hypothetical protein
MSEQKSVRKVGYGPDIREHLIRSIEENEPHFAEAEAEIRRVESEKRRAKSVRTQRTPKKRVTTPVATLKQTRLKKA